MLGDPGVWLGLCFVCAILVVFVVLGVVVALALSVVFWYVVAYCTGLGLGLKRVVWFSKGGPRVF